MEQPTVAITRELDGLRGKADPEANARRDELYARLRLIGATAAFFGGYDGMKKLHDAAEQLVGNTNEAGYYVNRAWDLGGRLARLNHARVIARTRK
ncbi:hypothetical protein GWK50_19230 (plasmid) [Acidovorax sp. 210-6]|jgi:hypothetical protein|uniref:hypothetical protein n=1 Tax=Acidovorax sp. 210-6 TaxID=2699468 RepID=UPI00138A68C8|nr:hypothetical protein [Acidovorax sp. 210-6]NCU67958.1 hypothetical protein [Acidovorax sp. 210-6]